MRNVLKFGLIGFGGYLLLRNSNLLSMFGGGVPAPVPPAGGTAPSGGGGSTAVPTPATTPASGSPSLPTGGGGSTTTPAATSGTVTGGQVNVPGAPAESVLRAAAVSASNAGAAGSWRLNFHQWNFYRHQYNAANPAAPISVPPPDAVGQGDGTALITAAEFHQALRGAGLSGWDYAESNYMDLAGAAAAAAAALRPLDYAEDDYYSALQGWR
ncbi:MAG: hypothetical protein CUN53_00120 [Phototrophicales bacterium]|nr:MAG: hypothetical protein CUN53_00120 [Phototrophicales bacterium]